MPFCAEKLAASRTLRKSQTQEKIKSINKTSQNKVQLIMSIDIQTVERIAYLSRLKIDAQQQQSMSEDLTKILAFVEQLGAVDTTGVQPMTSVVEAFAPLREDQVTDGGYPERILANAPERVQNFFVVPKVVE